MIGRVVKFERGGTSRYDRQVLMLNLNSLAPNP